MAHRGEMLGVVLPKWKTKRICTLWVMGEDPLCSLSKTTCEWMAVAIHLHQLTIVMRETTDGVIIIFEVEVVSQDLMIVATKTTVVEGRQGLVILLQIIQDSSTQYLRTTSLLQAVGIQMEVVEVVMEEG